MAEVPENANPEVKPSAEEQVADDDQKPIYNKYQMADVVKREKDKAFEKGKAMALEQLQQQAQPQQQDASAAQSPMQQAPQAPQSQNQGMGGMPNMSPDDVRRMIAEQAPQHLQQHLQQQATARQAEGFVQKMRAAEAKHPGLEAKLEKLDWTHMGPVIKLIDNAANPGDIMRELVENPMKMGNLVTLAHTQPHLAQMAVSELSNSIAQNHAAQAQEVQGSEPLDHLNPSNVGSDAGSKGSVRDFKRKYRG